MVDLECGFTVNPLHSACDLTRSLKSFDFALHNSARDVPADAAIGGGAQSSCVEPDGWWSDERCPEIPVTPDFGASRDGVVTGYDVHCHCAVSHAATHKSRLIRRCRAADLAKCNGHGRIETYRSKRDAAVSARTAAIAARRAGDPAAPRLADRADKLYCELASCFHPGYAAAAAARGHSFRPVALSEFGGFAPSAMLALAGITHPGDELDADQEGERFFADGQSWATATHRAFTVHSLAASMCRAAYHAARSATSCRPISAPSR